MKINSLDDIQQDQWEEIKASDVRSFIKDELTKVNEDFVAKVAAEKAAAEKAQSDLLASQAAAAEAKETAEKVQKELEDLKLAVARETQAAAFNQRMEDLDAEYELTDASRKVIAKQIRELDDAAYASWKEDFDALTPKAKEGGEETPETPEQAATKGLSTAAKKDGEGEVPNSSGGERSDKDAYKKSFTLGEGVKIR